MPVQRIHFPRYFKVVIFWLLLGACLAVYWTSFFPSEKNIPIQIKFSNIPDHLVVVNYPETPFNGRLSGPSSVVENLAKEKLDYSADLSGVHKGQNLIKIFPKKIPLPNQTTIKQITPSHINVTLEKKISKRLPVLPRYTGTPKFGWIVTDKKIEPKTVLLEGADSILTLINAVSTQPVDLTNLTGTTKHLVALDLPDESITQTPKIFSVEIITSEQMITKTFKSLLIYKKNTSYQAIIQPDAIDITVIGPLIKVSGNFSKDDIDAYVDLDKLPPGVHVKPATINLPLGVSLIKADPEIFTIQITKTPNKILTSGE